MSSMPTRRTLRTTAALNENANARPSRLAASKAKPATAGSSSTATVPAPVQQPRATSTTAASRARVEQPKAETAAGKRKREALGEVSGTANNNTKLKARSKTMTASTRATASQQDPSTVDGVAGSSKSSKTATGSRQPLRTVAGPTVKRVTRGAAAVQAAAIKEEEETKGEEEEDEDAMMIDPPAPAVARRLSSRRSVVAAREAAPVATIVTARRRSVRAAPVPKQEEEAADEEQAVELEDVRVKKKARTSSEAPIEFSEDAGREAVYLNQDDEENVFDVEPETEQQQQQLEFEEEVDVEADPDGPDWADLDEEDHDDPLMVSEYVGDIFTYMKEVELETMANPNYMETQGELAWKMRGILTDWLVQVHVRFHLLPETLFLCVNIIDRFLSARVVSLAKLQLVGVTCMFIAAKYEEIMAPSVQNFHYCADSTYEEKEILLAERYVLKTLDWNLSYPNPVHFLRRVSKADEYDVKVRTIAKYLLEIGCLEWRLISVTPSMMAAAAIWFARMVLGREVWTPNLAHYSSYSESTIVPTANLMLNYVLKPVAHESFYKKYASKKYYKASIFVQAWALARWEASSHVDLAAELPALKAQIRMERERTEAAALAAQEAAEY